MFRPSAFRFLRRFVHDTRGATAIEYGLIASIMFLACLTVFYAFGESANDMFDRIVTAIKGVTDGPSGGPSGGT